MKSLLLLILLLPLASHAVSRAPAVIEEPKEYSDMEEPEDKYWLNDDEDESNKQLELLEKKQREIISDEYHSFSEEEI